MRTLSLFLITFLVFSTTAYAAPRAETSQPAKIKAEVQKHGTGEKSRVKVTLANGTLMKGHISKIDDSSFDVIPDKAAQPSTIAYADVSKVQGPGLSRGAKIGIGVVVGAAAVATVGAIIYETKVNCKTCI